MKTYQKLSLSLLTICISQQLYAETNDLQANQTPTATLDTIVITAGKIDRTAQDTVESVKVTTAQELEDNPALIDFYDVLKNTSNVTSESDYNINIRGVNTQSVTGGGAAPTINYMLDGVTQNNRSTYTGNISTWDIEQVEVLRGPQSTTAGQNALAGSVVIQSKDPEFEQAGKAQVGYGTDNTYQAAFANTGAITDKLAYRISAEHKHTDGHSKNTYFKQDDWNNSDTNTVRGKLLYLINDESDIKLTLSQTKLDINGSSETNSKKEHISYDNTPTFYNTETTNTSIEYNNDFSENWSLKSTTAYSKTDYDRSSDNDGRFGLSTWNNKTKSKQMTEELLFNFDNADNLKAVVGLYAATGEDDNSQWTNDFPLQAPGIPIPVTVNNKTKNFTEYDNYAAFFNADYQVTDKLTLLAGLRYDYDKRTNGNTPEVELVKGTGNPYIDQNIQGFLSQAVGEAKGEHVNKVWLPKLGLNYAWNDNLKTGIQYQRGYRPGGASVNIVRREVKQFDPEFTNNFELSTRYKNDSGNFSLQGNLFYTDWKDQQVSVDQSDFPYDTYDVNAGKSHLYGLELDAVYQMTPEVELTGGIGLLQTEFDEFTNNGVDFAGKEFEQARNVTSNLGMTYRDPAGWFFGGYANYNGKGWDNLENDIELEAYTLVNLKAGYETENWGAYAYVNNFFDTNYVYNQWDFGGYEEYYIGDPRTLGVTVNYEW
ncbi:TonB-dependent receptor [Psychrobacter sp. HD31]|uniref:TonB-dependent receptor n=1 Tax=Psychrobacter sp. HD31 TaxID=3112003 RepID=UPI003DA3F157